MPTTKQTNDDGLNLPPRPKTFAEVFSIEDFKCVLRMAVELKDHLDDQGYILPPMIAQKYQEFIKLKDLTND